jgi:ketosteroid isomerase-like protein
MAENVEVLRGAYEAFGRGDMAAVTATWEDDIEYRGPDSARTEPYRGTEEVAGLFAGMRERWDDLRLTPSRFVEQEDMVVVLGRMEGRATSTGTELSVPFAHVWKMRDGKICGGQAFTDTAAIAAAHGG